MSALSLVTKGKICRAVVVERVISGGGGVIHRDRYIKTKKPTKQECEYLYFPKITMGFLEIIREADKEFKVVVTFLEAIG